MKPLLGHKRPIPAHVAVYAFVIIPFLALLAAVPVAWGWGLAWLDIVLAGAFYVVTCLGATVGFHRYFTHGAFKAHRWLRIVLAVVGSMSVQGPILHWVADHRRHHAFADKEGDPHSPWLFGTSPLALARGFWHAHLGWVLDRNLTNQERFAPDLLADRDMRIVHRLFGPLTIVTLALPAVLGGLISWSWWGAITAFFWAGLVRVTALHHVTWSVNSVCHMIGDRPFAARDRSANFWPLAILSMGESWHNLHHADPTSARHGVLPGQIDISARLIWLFEKAGWAWDVRWPTRDRVARLRLQNA
ncbi:acyl-CoA desaturase [Dactylosporangium sp. AC04546]|uniref:acyl-CoA desaturase n=1 Tax=Dactylosporangium sp. AC04546 TaxID=2862460 RepID=UPI001EDDCC8A|nr:acyl-CoA desaturase [Dactylosporangium sp. AC04546]WVK87609.1 acyl-CoA desaturase [Dactylosporangium sp. AC04546]